jgi:hypothetical protein
MRHTARRLAIVGRPVFLLAPFLLGGCFYLPSTSLGVSPSSRLDPPVVISGEPYQQADDELSSNRETARISSERRAKSSEARAKAAPMEPHAADERAIENQNDDVDDAALKKSLVICDGCLTKSRQKREAADQTRSSAAVDQQFR